ncbi:MAG: glycosyltransferase family 2 protein [Winogradskyella sp.]|uniref:TIGR04283 family arsenosugar biosynthesis glycosyltransferase n=1 Tax=Winogradskyella sp. TaxID=1883156 RepID=UPI0018456A2B|nr:TIGR04283 family arsenosugar biosynthesis glycosyltransferase [Winogradskyella sp.]MBT8245951.1 TIGR04283 family arsenosugar biosynthesis glycosyltransferase [Winogradskyella sp.]NNK21773.1 glycosyltransferase family 2 protein [Winogradskyella sp.]
MISIVIPVLNEAKTIEKLLNHLVDCADLKNISEIIVVDGGSTDGTKNIIQNLELRVKLLTSEKGRAKQMNIGAKNSKGSILYFLHADSFPPPNYAHYIIEEIKKGNNAGCFRLQFDNKHWWLRLASWLTKFRWRACRGGDQSQFITKTLFEDIGGFDESYTIYEDNILINELYKRKEFVVINKKNKTSARLYKRHGIWTVQYHFWTIYVKRWFGASADELYAYYKKYLN